jgi:hypothetical protein
MATIAELIGASPASRRGVSSGASLVKSAISASNAINVTVIMQGQRVLMEDFFAFAQNADPIVQQLVVFFGEGLKEVAKEIHTPNIDTQATYDSISAGADPGGPPMPFRDESGGWAIDVGPFTEYAPFQEFGFTHHLSGAWIQNPFMMPAADVIEPLFGDAMYQLAEVADDRRFFTGPAAQSGGAQILGGLRNFLYSYSKFAGDIQILGVGGLSGSRGAALRGARLIGDVNAGMRGAIGTRFTRRFTGRWAAQGITAYTSTQFSGPSGAFTGSSLRIYNRIRGQALGQGLRGI